MNTKQFVLTLLAATSMQAATLEQQIDTYIKPFRDMSTFNGVILAARGDNVVFAKAYGMANYEHGVPNTLDTRFAIASITKPFTGIILRKLVEEKKLSMDDKLAKWVPDFPSADTITVDELRTHRSGIRDPQKLRGVVRRSLTTADTVDKLKTEPLGSKDYSYTTANYALLAHIIERVTGKTFAQVVKHYVYDPAKMNDSGELSTTAVVPRLANGYMPNPFGPGLAVCGPEDPSWKTGGGSSYSTVADLHRFARTFLATASPLSKSHDKPVHSLSGSFPGANANLLYFPSDEVTVVVLSNNYAGMAGVITETVAGMMFGKTYEPPAVKVAANPHTAPAHAEGSYAVVDRPWTFTFRFREGKPYIAWTEIRQGALLRVSEDTWFEVFDWGMLKLKFDESGKFVDGSFQFPNQEPLKVVRK